MHIKTLFLIASALSASGCGGGGGGGGSGVTGDSHTAPERAAAPQSVTVTLDDTDMVLDWGAVDGATHYSVYYSTQKDLDPANYAAYEGGTWVQQQTPPVSIPIQDMSAVYHFIISANVDSVEGEYSNEVIAVPRYVSASTTGWVKDRTTNFEWDRCPYGQSYNSTDHKCEGTATRMNFLEARTAAMDESGEVPVDSFISSIVFCSSGEPAYFPEDRGCTHSSIEPAVYEGAFPHSSTETTSFITATYCSVDTLKIYSFGGGASGICSGPPNSLFVNLRLMRRP